MRSLGFMIRAFPAALLAYALLLLSAAPLPAHEEPPAGAAGPVTKISSSSITVGGQTFQITPNTSIVDAQGNRKDVTAVRVNDLAAVTADGSIAKTIRVNPAQPPD